MNGAVLDAIAQQELTVASELEFVTMPVIKRGISDYISDDTMKVLVVLNSIFIFAYIMGWIE